MPTPFKPPPLSAEEKPKPFTPPPLSSEHKHDVITGAEMGGPSAPIGEQPVSPSGFAKTMLETGKGAAKELGSTAYGLATGPAAGPIGMGLGYLGKRLGITPKVEAATQPSNTSQSIGKYGTMAGEMLAPLPGALEVLPSTVRASENFNKAMALAKDVPVNTSHFEAPLIRAAEIHANTRAPLPGLMQKGLQDIAPTTAPRLNYKQVRDMAIDAGQKSVQAQMAPRVLTPPIKKLLAPLGKGLDVAAQEAANQAGPEAGRYHSLAMQEWRQAKNLEDIGKKALKYGTGAALTGGAIEGGRHIARRLLGQ